METDLKIDDSQPGADDWQERATRFVELLTSYQREMFAYINTLMIGDSSASDVLQDTNLDLWSRLSEYDFERPFLPWAFGFAFQRVLAYRKTRSRSRLVFSDEFLQVLSEEYVGDPISADTRLGALRNCIEKLDAKHGQLIRDRYLEKVSVKTLASRLGSNVNQISARLYRIRKLLAACIQKSLSTEIQ